MEKAVKTKIQEHPKTNVLILILLVTLVIALIGAIVQHNWGSMIFIVIIAALIVLPRIVGIVSNIEIPAKMGVYLILFIYTTLFLGELNNYYNNFWWWDVLVHISSGVAFGIMGFIILYMLHKSEKIETSPKTVAIFSFCFALAIGALWEIVEFTMDHTLGTNMQFGTFYWTNLQGGLIDTMKDLIDDSIGAIFSAVMGYLYLKRNSGIVVKPMVKEFKKDNPRLFTANKK